MGEQHRVENGLARRHLRDGTLVLYDVSSSYVEGRQCPLARFGHSRDKRRDRPQIVYGLLCTRQGLPVAVEVFDGNTADPTTLGAQVDKLKQRFRLERVVLVGDRGMITTARIREDLQPAGLDWISCLRAPQIQALATQDGPLQLSLFDDRDLAEIESPDYPGERLVVCRNPDLAADRARKRGELLEATERDLARIQERVRRARKPLKGGAAIGQAVGAVLNRRKVGKHFQCTITDADFSFARNGAAIEAEARLDGIYVIRTSVEADALSAGETVQAYKDLARVERAFRCLKTVDLDIRPIRHWAAPRVRAHVFLCMLAYHVEWHLRQALAPLLFHDTDRSCPRRALLAGRQDRALGNRQTQEGHQTQPERPARYGLCRPPAPSRHLGRQHHGRPAAGKPYLHPLYPKDPAPGGCLRTPRLRPATCPVTQNHDRQKTLQAQYLAVFNTSNFGLERI